MKKLKLSALLLMALSVLALGGCSSRNANANSTHETDLENQIKNLKQQIATLEKQAADTASTTNPSNTAAEPSLDVTTETIDSLGKLVDDAIAKIDTAKATENVENNKKHFLELKHMSDSAEDKLDAYDDFLESKHRQGTLSYEEYRKQEHSLEQLEDKLDAAEDKLEMTFKIGA